MSQDSAEAVKWYRLAAEQGLAYAQSNLGVMYKEGRGVSQDHAEAVKWFRLATEQRDAAAQNNLGRMYFEGLGVTNDYAQALKWYRKAAEQRHAEAQYNLGLMFHYGQGVPQDDVEAVKWYRLAAEQGHAEGQNKLGLMYHVGRGVPQNHAEGKKWDRKAAEQGYSVQKQKNRENIQAEERKKRNSVIEILNWSWKEEHGYAVVVGQIQNISANRLKLVQAVAGFYEESGNFITSDTALIEYDPLLPGQQSPFRVMARWNPAMKRASISFKLFAGQKLNTYSRK